MLEICCGDIESVIAARDGGATRVELCSGLAEGGLTPSAALIRSASEVEGIAVNVLVRPRPGDFVYSEAEKRIILDDIACSLNLGADGIATGALDPEGNVDMAFCREMVSAAKAARKDCDLTFHRAFDLVNDARKSLEDLIALGFNRVLTSGLASSAAEGAETLRELKKMARGRISIMAGAGVNPSNAKMLLEAGADELHGSARKYFESRMKFRRENVKMGLPGEDEYLLKKTDRTTVALLREAFTQR